MKMLSPTDLVGVCVLSCRAYCVATIHLRVGAPWTKTLREIGWYGDIVFKDEFTRRIVVEVSLDKAASLMEGIQDTASSLVYEVKVVCRGLKSLPGEGRWRIVSRSPRLAAYGVLHGRHVFAEHAGKSIVFKIGKRSRALNPPSLLPASAFQFTGKELLGVIGELDRLVKALSR